MLARVVAFIFCICTFAAGSWAQDPNSTYGGFCPPGSRPVGGSGYMCLCADGSYAGINGCSGGGGGQVNRCPNGGTCRLDQTCCGNWCCGSGSYCSRFGCTPHGAIDCGNHYCNPGDQCSRTGCIPQGTVDCGPYYCQQGEKCGKSRRACLAHDAIDCGSYDCTAGSKCGSGNKCLTANAVDCGGGRSCPSGQVCLSGGAQCRTHQQIAEEKRDQQRQVLASVDQQRRQELQKRQQTLADCQADCNVKKLIDIANGGDGRSVICLCNAPANSGTNPRPPGPSLQRQTQQNYLRQNAVRLQPEQRQVAIPAQQAPAPNLGPQSNCTFMCGSPPNQYKCPCAIEAARKKTDEIYSSLGLKPDQILARLEERRKKCVEYVRDSPQVKDAIRSIQAKSVGFVTAGPAGMELADNLLTIQSFFEGINEFQQGKHYEGTLRAVNEGSSYLAEKLGLPPGSADVLNLTGAATTSCIYGFFYGI
jgi:hypothetical protein